MSITAGADVLGHQLVNKHAGAGLLRHVIAALLGDLVAVLYGNLVTAFHGNLIAVLLGLFSTSRMDGSISVHKMLSIPKRMK